MNDIVVGLGFGDEGKGTVVDWLTSQKDTNAVVRFSGGAQAAHNVITPDGKHHTFAQLGSGSFNQVRTILSRFMLVNPFSLVKEAQSFETLTGWDALRSLLISEEALMTTPVHVAMNHRREIDRGANAHGSCGLGIGETQDYGNKFPELAPRMGDLLTPDILAEKLSVLYGYAQSNVGDIDNLAPTINEMMESYISLKQDGILRVVSDRYLLKELHKGYNVFEGSQGVLLDETFGFHPHTTWSTVTQKNAQVLLSEAGLERGNVIGVTRTYGTRHGNGPFPSELVDPDSVALFPEVHNGTGRFQGHWRVGQLDLPLLAYAVEVNGGVDEVAVTHCDSVSVPSVISYGKSLVLDASFGELTKAEQEMITNRMLGMTGKKQGMSTDIDGAFFEIIEEVTEAPVRIVSYGPRRDQKGVWASSQS